MHIRIISKPWQSCLESKKRMTNKCTQRFRGLSQKRPDTNTAGHSGIFMMPEWPEMSIFDMSKSILLSLK